MVTPTKSPFSLPIWPVHMADGSWRMIMDYFKLNQGMTAVVADLLDVIHCLSKLTLSLVLSTQLLIRIMPLL